MKISNKMNFFASLGLLGGSLVISIVYPHIIAVLGFIGGVLVCTFGILFPGIIQKKLLNKHLYKINSVIFYSNRFIICKNDEKALVSLEKYNCYDNMRNFDTSRLHCWNCIINKIKQFMIQILLKLFYRKIHIVLFIIYQYFLYFFQLFIFIYYLHIYLNNKKF